MDIIQWYLLELHPLTPPHVAGICQDITHTDVATPELVTFGVVTQSSQPRP